MRTSGQCLRVPVDDAVARQAKQPVAPRVAERLIDDIVVDQRVSVEEEVAVLAGLASAAVGQVGDAFGPVGTITGSSSP
jgi:hypothetical protein